MIWEVIWEEAWEGEEIEEGIGRPDGGTTSGIGNKNAERGNVVPGKDLEPRRRVGPPHEGELATYLGTMYLFLRLFSTFQRAMLLN